ncbi:hypothetical protein JCM18909A_20270 [Cutibacterium acnes subsp. elongatum]
MQGIENLCWRRVLQCLIVAPVVKHDYLICGCCDVEIVGHHHEHRRGDNESRRDDAPLVTELTAIFRDVQLHQI